MDGDLRLRHGRARAQALTVDTGGMRPGRYRLCVDAPAAGQFAAAQDCQRWRVKARRHT